MFQIKKFFSDLGGDNNKAEVKISHLGYGHQVRCVYMDMHGNQHVYAVLCDGSAFFGKQSKDTTKIAEMDKVFYQAGSQEALGIIRRVDGFLQRGNTMDRMARGVMTLPHMPKLGGMEFVT